MAAAAREVGRAQVQAQLGLEVLDRRLVDAAAGVEAADEVDERAQRVAARRRVTARRRRRVGEVGRRRARALVRLAHALKLARRVVGHDDAPAGVEEGVGDRDCRGRRCRP